MLTPVFPYGSDPSASPPQQPTPRWSSCGITNILTDGNAKTQHGKMNLVGATVAPATGSLTVANNDFSTGRAEIRLGNFRLTSNVDFVPGINVQATAVVIAAAISRLFGFAATAPGAGVVNIQYQSGPADRIQFEVIHYGTITNFTPLDPTTGILTYGSPAVGAPDVS